MSPSSLFTVSGNVWLLDLPEHQNDDEGCFKSSQDTKAARTVQLMKQNIQNRSRKWQEQWKGCIQGEEEYFERDLNIHHIF